MTKLCELLQSDFGYQPIVVLPLDGEGKELLKEASIRYINIRSYSWIVSLDYQWTLSNYIKCLVKK